MLSSGRLRTTIKEVSAEEIIIESFNVSDISWLSGKSAWIHGEPVGLIIEAMADRLVLDNPPVDAAPGDILEIDSGLEAPVLAMKLLVPEASDPAAALSFRLGTTKGTNALLENKGAPVALFLTEGFEDLLVIRDQKRPALFAREIQRDTPLYHRVYAIKGRIDTFGKEEQPLDNEQLASAAKKAISEGCSVAAICFMNSWQSTSHEDQAVRILKQAGFSTVSASAQIRPLIKYLDRTETTLVNATLSPVMDAYLDQVEEGIHGNPLWIMTSAGGLVSRERFHAVDSLVSGPAGGVLGAVQAGRRAGLEKIIALDMGGTSTDVSRWKDQLELRQHIQVGQARLLTPAMPIETVAAGGGSICGFRDGRLFVGPESAGADPGPASYGAGGPLCLTDIHLLLGRIDPAGFSIPIRLEAARKRLDEVLEASGETDWEALAEGFLTIATERMAHAIRQVTLRDGEDPADYGLVAFGGAGGLHACRVASELGIPRIIFPPDAGILSAKGIHYAPREAVREEQLFRPVNDASDSLTQEFLELHRKAIAELASDGVAEEDLDEPLYTVYIRIAGQETGIPVSWLPGVDLNGAFEKQFVAIFGYYPKSPLLEIVKIRLRLLEHKEADKAESFSAQDVVLGPHVISDPFGTCFVEKGWLAVSGDAGSVELRRSGEEPTVSRAQLENVERTLVMNRLEGLVEEMGDQLQRTALSTNIRERLDFSCALMDAEGRLLVNAPHIPVHLGAMGLCVRESVKELKPFPGDVIITNHPGYGGSHLPDVTLITAVHDDDQQLIGYLANRAHHAEWGGTSPGSMPADATNLMQEGVVIAPTWLIRQGRDCFAEVERLLKESPFPSRAPRENRIDLEAQLASLMRGRELLSALLHDYGSKKLKKYFGDFYQMGAEALSRSLDRTGGVDGQAREAMDDGHCIVVHVKSVENKLLVDFSGTSAIHPGNLNATPAIVRSAVLYVLRLLVDSSMPLNEGLLDAVEIKLPVGFLNPSFPQDAAQCPAVVGGNVETSQRIVDALIRALGIIAASQGTMNNFLFGNDRFGYYETIGGGSGAGKEFNGASGVHVHMTNTAITDPEILEQRFPVSCREFSLRKGSGGIGKRNGGDGLVREIRFHEAVTISLLTQNRVKGARGMKGGGDGKPGRQWHVRLDGTRVELSGIAQLAVGSGEAIRIETPGGAGWGS